MIISVQVKVNYTHPSSVLRTLDIDVTTKIDPKIQEAHASFLRLTPQSLVAPSEPLQPHHHRHNSLYFLIGTSYGAFAAIVAACHQPPPPSAPRRLLEHLNPCPGAFATHDKLTAWFIISY
jgi:hypothetical protein